MISKILLKNIASYWNIGSFLETDKKVNLVYGLNWTWKTTFSNFLSNRDNSDFSNCLIEWLSDEKIIVYNQNFIEKNFYQKDTQKWIFTLSSENKEAEEKIKQATEEIWKIKLELNNIAKNTWLEIDLAKNKTEITNLFEKSKKKTWEIKTKYSWWDRILEFCLDGKKWSQDLLFNYIKNLKKEEEKPVRTIEELKNEAESTQWKDVKEYNEDEIKKVNFDFWLIENSNIFEESIIWNESSQVSDLIKKLSNWDWVKQGIDYIHEDSEICPFCQNQTITSNLKQEIEDYFDESYQNKIAELEKLKDSYLEEIDKIKINESELLKNDFIKNKEISFKLYYKNFTEKLNSNLLKIQKKIKNPSKIITLDSTFSLKESFNNFLEEIITEIKLHNLKIRNKDKTKKEIINTFWQIMRWEYDQTIEIYISQNKKLEEDKKLIETNISNLKQKEIEQNKIIKIAQKEIINIDEAIWNINIELKFLGAEWFEIIKEWEDSYKIKRNSEQNSQFKTLSEWEKTIISFLYFLELCKWKEYENETITEKIIVIDDPISSLSHIYIFNIAGLIRKNFFTDDYKQVFILTHSLYFFHELLFKSKKLDKKLFRITKNICNESNIFEMKQNEIQNDYQSYWQVLKDYNNGNSSNTLLANSMRNILEHFFWFINKYTFQNITESIEKEEKYNFFVRYINKESHSDLNTISDMKEIDPIIFQEAFKKIFEENWYKEHYNIMIWNI